MSKRIVLSTKSKTKKRSPIKYSPVKNIELLEDKYNALSSNECKWPTNKNGSNVQDCNFNLEPFSTNEYPDGIIPYNNDYIILVKIPIGTKLYHATLIPPFEQKWFEHRYPENLEKGAVWFASTQNHASMVNSNYILEYITKKEMIMVFERNLKKYGKGTRGYEYIPTLLKIKAFLHPKINPMGYLGCMECEIALFNRSVEQCLEKEPINVIEKTLKYID
jgi:hypothetical protein